MSKKEKSSNKLPLQVQYVLRLGEATYALKRLELLCKENGSENLGKNIARMTEILRLNVRCELGLTKKDVADEPKQ